MAIVTRQSTGERITDPAAVEALLSKHGLVYERWDIQKLEQNPKPEGVDIETHLLELFSEEIQALCDTRGYQTSDVVALHPQMENLDDILAKFDKEHTHTEDEVRFTVAGRGMFAIRGVDNEIYEIEVLPGDLLAVPEGTKHYFTLLEERHIQCIRLFSDTTGWVAHYVEESAAE